MRSRPRPLLLAPLVLGFLLLTPGRAVAAGAWQWPLGGTPVVTRGFDPPPAPWAPGHRGVDLAAKTGGLVLAAGGGVVGFAGLLAGRGVVTVHHGDGLETTYEPLTVLVHAGQPVRAGQPLGRVRAGHGDCGPAYVCLHWGLRRGATYLDPLQLLRSGPVRLLPLWRGGLRAPAVAVAAEGVAPATHRHESARDGPAVAAAAVAAMSVASGLVALARRRRRAAAR